jgi:hypothetical protein
MDRVKLPATVGLLKDLQIIEHEVFMAVTWRSGCDATECRGYSDLNLGELLEEARSLREHVISRRAADYERLFRSLGQRLDDESLQMSGIVERDAEFIVSGSIDRCYVKRPYSKDALRRADIERRILRTDTPTQGQLAISRPSETTRPQPRWLSHWRKSH